MRVFFPNLERPKKAAQRFAAHLPGVKLHLAQIAIARAVGYENWHELERSHTEQAPTPLDQFWQETDFRTHAAGMITEVAAAISLLEGDVLYALSNARLTGDRIWTLDDHKAIRLALWRTANVFGSTRHAPGTIIRMKSDGSPARICYLCRYERPTRVLYDTGIGVCADFEVVVPREKLPEFLPSRLWLPYGIWTLRDGSDVVFSRDYFPLWRVSGVNVERLPPWLWIEDIKDQQAFMGMHGWDWSGVFARAQALDYLMRHNVRGLPILSEALPRFFDPGIDRFHDAVRAMMVEAARPDPVGPWHRSNRFVDWHRSAA
jgi:hypothetical protein